MLWRSLLRVGVTLLLASTVPCVPTAAQQSQSVQPAVAVDAIATILDAFRSHQIVALGEGAHGNLQGHAFRLSLIRDPRFAAIVNDVVVEFGSARYQALMDQFIAGDDISDTELRQVWQDTTQPNAVWDTPIYEEFFRAVRGVNASLPQNRRLRVLLGDPPFDWDRVHTFNDLLRALADPMANRDRYPVDVIRREVVAKQRRALVIYGDAHLLRVGLSDTIVSLLESTPETKVFTVTSAVSMPGGAQLETLQPDVATWSRPSLSFLPNTVLGMTEFGFYYPAPMTIQNGKPVAVIPDRWRSLRLQDQFDALLYLGPASSITMDQMSRERCADAAYMNMRLGRIALSPVGQAQADRLKQACAAQERN